VNDGTGEGRSGSAEAGPPRDGNPLVEVRELTVSHGAVDVLEGVSLSVARGEFVGLVGPNGAGKTTLLNAINGVVDPDGGTVRVAGDDIEDLSARETGRRVATVPQDTTVAFDFSVADVVEMGRTPYHGRLSGDPDAETAVERALERTDTAGFRDRPVGSLSGGERQRVVLARALAQATPALLLDEPTASLDVNHQVRTLGLVRELTRGGEDGQPPKGAVAAIHDLDLAARFCDRVAVLADGDLLASGPPGDVLTSEHLRTAFDTDAAVLTDPVTGTPTVTPVATRGEWDLQVHVAGSGRLAARAAGRLHEAGATVTVGPVPEGDLAATTARELGVEVVTAPPFAPLDAGNESAARELLAAADAVVTAGPMPPSLVDLVRDCSPLLRVRPDATDAVDDQMPVGTVKPMPSSGHARRGRDSPDPAETVAAGSVVTGVRRVVRDRLAADD